METAGHAISEVGRPQGQGADSCRRITAIVAASSGNLVEWYDFYAYAFTSIYFASAFFPSGNATSQLLAAAGIFAVGFFMRPLGGWLLDGSLLGAVDLHEFANAVPAIVRLVNGLEPLPSVAPEAVGQHPLPDRLDPEMDAVSLSQLLAGKCRTEVGVVGLDQPQRLRSERRRIAAVARLAAAFRNERRRPSLPIRLGQPKHVAARQPRQLGSLIHRNPVPPGVFWTQDPAMRPP